MSRGLSNGNIQSMSLQSQFGLAVPNTGSQARLISLVVVIQGLTWLLLCCHVQAEYVRCSEEASVLRTLQDRRSALAVALPGTERQLQSRTQHDKRMSRLVDRMAKLMVELQLQEPLAEGTPEYQRGLAALRDEQLSHLQQQVEREAAALAEATHVRRQLGAACEQTRNQDRKARRRRTCIRQLVDTMSTWQQKALPASAVTQQLPAQWTEQAIKQLLRGQFPWQHTAGGSGRLPSLLVERFRDACAEVRATAESTRCHAVHRMLFVQPSCWTSRAHVPSRGLQKHAFMLLLTCKTNAD